MPSIRDEITRTFARIGKWRPDDATVALPSLPIKAQIEQYRVLKRLGTGGMGQVYLALDIKLDRHVALKALSPDLTAEPAYVNRFKQEARAASALNHPNILTIYDFIETEGAQIIVSEYVQGGTLRGLMERGPMEPSQALDIACQAASALVAAHATGVIHRDLKPTNIMIRPDGYVKVIDFGLAKLAERSGFARNSEYSLTRPGTVVGTVRYMSPEQARGEPVDHRGDLWSLGVVLYEMLAGQSPFEGTTDNHLIVAILDAPPRPIPGDRVLPTGLSDVLARALAKDRRQRYQTAAEFLSAIQSVQRSSGTVETVRILRPRRVLRHGWIYSLVLALVLAGFFLWWGPFGGRWRLQRPDWFELGQTERLTFDGDVQRAALSPDGKRLAYTTGAPGSEILHLKEIRGSEDHTLAPTEQTYTGLTFSPDARMLFFVLRDARQELGTLFSVPIQDFGRVPEATLLADVDGPITFAPDGASFAFVRRKELDGSDLASICVAPINDVHQLRTLVSLQGAEMYGRLSWSRNGIAVVVVPSRVQQGSVPAIYIFDENGKLKSQTSSPNFRMLGAPAFSVDGRSLLIGGLTQGALQSRLEQLFLPTGEWRTLTSDLAGFDEISVANGGDSVAAVRKLLRSSVYVLDESSKLPPVRLGGETEYFSSLTWTPEGGLIVPSSRSGNVNLAMLNPDGSMRPFLQPLPAFEMDPATAPGVADVVFSSNAAHGGDEFNIWKFNPSRRKPTRLTSGANADVTPQLTPDGKWVVYVSSVSGAQTLWRIPLQGGRPEAISKLRARNPFVSPDGRSVVCEIRQPNGEWQVAVLSLRRGELLRTMPAFPIGGLVRWSPDGSALDYIAHENGAWRIRRQPLIGGDPIELASSPEQRIVYFAWSPNGQKLAYIVRHGETDAVLLRRASRQ